MKSSLSSHLVAAAAAASAGPKFSSAAGLLKGWASYIFLIYNGFDLDRIVSGKFELTLIESNSGFGFQGFLYNIFFFCHSLNRILGEVKYGEQR